MRGRQKIFTHTEEEEEISINLTPLIDVVFVILIMFIIVAPLLEVDRVELSSAAAHQDKEMASLQENSPLTLHVRADNSIWYHKKEITLEQLAILLKKTKGENPKCRPQLFQDKSAHFGTYQNVKNAIEMAGFETLDVILQSG